MDRRAFFTLAGTGFVLAACAGQELPKLPIAVSVTLPPEIKSVVDDATTIIDKVQSIAAAAPDVLSLVDKAKGFVSQLTAGAGDTKTVVTGLVSALGAVAGLLPPPYGTIALAIETLLPVIGSVAGLRMAARRPTGMSPAQARAVLRS